MNYTPAKHARVGDMLIPDPLWNRTEGNNLNHLTNPTEILAVIKAQSQSGVLFRVRTKGGYVRDLDGGWFIGFAE